MENLTEIKGLMFDLCPNVTVSRKLFVECVKINVRSRYHRKKALLGTDNVDRFGQWS